MPDRFADGCGPECDDRNATTVAAFHFFAHSVRLRRSPCEPLHVVLAPIVARALKRPHVVGGRLGIDLLRAKAMLLNLNSIDSSVGGSRVFVSYADYCNIWKVVVRFDHELPVDG